MSVEIDVVKSNPFAPCEHELFTAFAADRVDEKFFARQIVGLDYVLLRGYEMEDIAERICDTHPVLSKTIIEIARSGGRIQIS